MIRTRPVDSTLDRVARLDQAIKTTWVKSRDLYLELCSNYWAVLGESSGSISILPKKYACEVRVTTVNQSYHMEQLEYVRKLATLLASVEDTPVTWRRECDVGDSFVLSSVYRHYDEAEQQKQLEKGLKAVSHLFRRLGNDATRFPDVLPLDLVTNGEKPTSSTGSKISGGRVCVACPAYIEWLGKSCARCDLIVVAVFGGKDELVDQFHYLDHNEGYVKRDITTYIQYYDSRKQGTVGTLRPHLDSVFPGDISNLILEYVVPCVKSNDHLPQNNLYYLADDGEIRQYASEPRQKQPRNDGETLLL
jgi:hypothetical protein